MKRAPLCRPRPWGLAEWGSIASILGVAFYFLDKWTTNPAPDASEHLS